jgi:hypothetical protein
MTQELTRDDYAANLNTDFVVNFTPEFKVTMKLIEATEEVERFRQRAYSLLFQAPEDTPIAQGMLQVEHEKLGKFELFMVPVGKDDRGVLFESLFNKLLERT